MKTKEQEIKAIKDEQRKLADRLEALEQPEQPKPKAGEVWRFKNDPFNSLVDNRDSFTALDNSAILCHNLRASHEAESPGGTRLGTFDEVYIERRKVAEEYVKKSDLSAVLSDSSVRELSGLATRMHISGKFNLRY